MNLIKYISIILIFLLTQVYAVDISAQIAQLKSAKKSEKYLIMNKIKMQISKLNSAQRKKAITQLRRATSNTGSTVKTVQKAPTLPVHFQNLPQIPVLPAPQNPKLSIPHLPGPSVPSSPEMPVPPSLEMPMPEIPQMPGQVSPEMPVPSSPQMPMPEIPRMPGKPSPGNIPVQTPSVKMPSSAQPMPKGGQ